MSMRTPVSESGILPNKGGGEMAIKAKIGAGQWDYLVCEECDHTWHGLDIDAEWTDDPEPGGTECPSCDSTKVSREERG